MPKSKRKLPIAPVPNEAQVEINWDRVELAFGAPLPAQMKESVREATLAFVEADEAVRLTESPADSKAIINKCREAATKFQHALTDHAFKSSDAGNYARSLINENFDEGKLGGKPLDTLWDILGSFRIACAKAIRDMNDDRGFDEISAWRAWIARLADIWEAHGRPVTVRKDSGNKSRSDKASPFVAFVSEIQKSVPGWRSYADSALPSAIDRVLRVNTAHKI